MQDVSTNVSGAVFGPEEIRNMTTAFDQILRELGLGSRSDPDAQDAAKIIASEVVFFAAHDKCDPDTLCVRVIESLRSVGRYSGC